MELGFEQLLVAGLLATLLLLAFLRGIDAVSKRAHNAVLRRL